MKWLVVLTMLLVGCTHTETSAVTLLDGTATTLESRIHGKPTIVVFWASWCPLCRVELPMVQEVLAEHPAVQVVAVNLQEQPSVVQRYWQDNTFTFATLLDPQRKLAIQYEVITQPTTLFIDAKGTEIFRKNGPITKDELKQYIEQLKQEEKSSNNPIIAQSNVSRNAQSSSSAAMTSVDSIKKIQIAQVPSLLSHWYQDTVQHIIPLDQIFSGGPPKDGIPSINEPVFTTVGEVDFLSPEDSGLLLTINGDTRFYAFKILNWHEIVNDTVGGIPVAVTYCPLCATAITYDRRTQAGESAFGVSGMLYQSNLLMYDRLTESLWSQATGQSVVGPVTGEQLTAVRSDIVQFSTVQAKYPIAKVLHTSTGYNRDYNRDPYKGYDQEEGTYFAVQTQDDRLFSKEIVYGVVIDGVAKAYPLTALQQEESLIDVIGNATIHIVYNPKAESVIITNSNTGLEYVPLYGFWFSWVAQYPGTGLYLLE